MCADHAVTWPTFTNDIPAIDAAHTGVHRAAFACRILPADASQANETAVNGVPWAALASGIPTGHASAAGAGAHDAKATGSGRADEAEVPSSGSADNAQEAKAAVDAVVAATAAVRAAELAAARDAGTFAPAQ